MTELCKEDKIRLRNDAKTLSDVASMLERDGRFAVLPSVLTDISEDLNRVVRKSEFCGRRKGGVEDAG